MLINTGAGTFCILISIGVDNMRFDVVVGNPPYNKDRYIDFVLKGFELSSNYTLMITPAKWQGKGGDKNIKMRDMILPYMSRIIFYPVTQDIFDIRNVDGLTIFLVGKKEVLIKDIENISKSCSIFNSGSCRKFDVLNNSLSSILYKFNKSFKPHSIDVRHFGLDSQDTGTSVGSLTVRRGNDIVGYYDINNIKRNNQDLGYYKVCMLHMNGNSFLGVDGKTLGMNKLYILDKNEIPVYNYMPIFVSYKLSECESFVSYFNCKLPRFVLFCSSVGQAANNSEYWRFVPDPGKFDCIFEDKPLDGYTPNADGEYLDNQGNKHCSLYIKYKLTADEINIIESVIRGR